MSDPDKKKDFWDKIASITPLILGIVVTGVGAFFTHIYNFRQLQLNQITALEKLRPLLTSGGNSGILEFCGILGTGYIFLFMGVI
jgi:hypothetical protein